VWVEPFHAKNLAKSSRSAVDKVVKHLIFNKHFLGIFWNAPKDIPEIITSFFAYSGPERQKYDWKTFGMIIPIEVD
jgi:hypothetical protein